MVSFALLVVAVTFLAADENIAERGQAGPRERGREHEDALGESRGALP